MRYALCPAITFLALGIGAPALAQHHGGGHGGGGHGGGGHVGRGHAAGGHGARGHGPGLRGPTRGARHHRGRFSLGLGFGTFGYRGYGGYYGGWPPYYYAPGGYAGFGYGGSGWRVLAPQIAADPLLRNWVMLRFDFNESGRLGRDEARAANAAFWTLTDRDGDGTASDEEWNDARGVASRELQAAYDAESPPPDQPPVNSEQ